MGPGSVKVSMSRAFLIGVILAALATLRGLAYASPPDASWIPGIYDNADLDDVVVLVMLASGVVGPVDLAGLGLPASPTTSPPLPREKVPTSLSTSPLHARAPPAA
jgi:hypothetical protein